MIKITLNIDGMKCVMCENHTNEAIKKAFKVKSVTSSHDNNQTVILTANDIDENALKDVITKAGFTLNSVEKETVKKKGFLIFGKH